MTAITSYDYNTNRYAPAPGTEDWVEVADLGEGGYDWTTFKVFYSPSARRYFWHGDSGCSCNSWEDGIGSAEDLQNGDRAAALRGWESFAKEYTYSITPADYIYGVSTIRDFKESEATR